MTDAPSTPRDAERLQRIARLLADLRVTEEYLRQYPGLAEKVAALLETSSAAGKPS